MGIVRKVEHRENRYLGILRMGGIKGLFALGAPPVRPATEVQLSAPRRSRETVQVSVCLFACTP